MKDDDSEVLFELTSPFKYAYKGDAREASFISLQAPTMKQHYQASQLKQSVMTMVRKEFVGAIETSDDKEEKDKEEKDKEEKDKEAEEITAEVVLTLMFASSNIDVNVVFGQAKTLFRKGMALVDGEERLTDSLIEKMSIDDFQNLTGEYIANFILA